MSDITNIRVNKCSCFINTKCEKPVKLCNKVPNWSSVKSASRKYTDLFNWTSFFATSSDSPGHAGEQPLQWQTEFPLPAAQ